MELYRQGKEYNTLLDYMGASSEIDYHYCPGNFKRTDYHYRIIGGALFLRTLTTMTTSKLKWVVSGVPVCEHLGEINPTSFQPLGTYLQWIDGHWRVSADSANFSSGQMQMHCGYCRTEFFVETERHDSCGSTIRFNKWQDLGAGTSFFEETWQAHLESEPKQRIFDYAPDSIRATFEAESRSISRLWKDKIRLTFRGQSKSKWDLRM